MSVYEGLGLSLCGKKGDVIMSPEKRYFTINEL